MFETHEPEINLNYTSIQENDNIINILQHHLDIALYDNKKTRYFLNFITKAFTERISDPTVFTKALNDEIEKYESKNPKPVMKNVKKTVITKMINSGINKQKELLKINKEIYSDFATEHKLIDWDTSINCGLKYKLHSLKTTISRETSRIHAYTSSRALSEGLPAIRLACGVDLTNYNITLSDDGVKHGYKIIFNITTKSSMKAYSNIKVSIIDTINDTLVLSTTFDKIFKLGMDDVSKNATFCLQWLMREIAQHTVQLNPLVDKEYIVTQNLAFNDNNKSASTALLPSIIMLMVNLYTTIQ